MMYPYCLLMDIEHITKFVNTDNLGRHMISEVHNHYALIAK
jgi:hypothetical protein